MTAADLRIEPLTPALMDAMGVALAGSWGRTCWCMFPRLTDKQMRALPGDGAAGPRRRAAMTALAARDTAPGLLAFLGDDPAGWVAVAPREELCRVDRARTTPPFDDLPAWVIPCITVVKEARGRGVAIALLEAAAAYAGAKGAPAVEGYPRAGDARVGDDSAYFGTEPLFRRAGFERVRAPLPNQPKNWIPRVVMRKTFQA